MSPSNMSSSDKENASPPPQEEHQTRVLASQAALREKLSENVNTQCYDPFQPREKVIDVTQKYRRMIQETNGILYSGLC